MLNESTSLYISSISEHSEIFPSNYSESDLVNVIKTGVNPETRAKLTFVANTLTFKELNNLCIHINEISKFDYLRSGFNQSFTPENAIIKSPTYYSSLS